MLMGSKLHGFPVSATEAAPPAVLSFTSTGIRAPLTIDDSDFEYSVFTDDNQDGALSSNDCDGELESDGFLSGEDGSETAPERLFLADSDYKILEETHFIKEYVVSRPSVKIPRVEINNGRSDDRNFEDSRSFFRDSDERIVEENVVVEEHNHPRPFRADACEEAVGTSMEEDKNATLVRLPVLDNGNAFMTRHGIPIAKLSRDSDDDFESTGSVEDETFLGVARVPTSGDLGRLCSVPKVRILEVGEGDDGTSPSDSGSEGESVEETVLVGGDNGLSKSCFQEKLIADDLITVEVIEDKGPFIAEEARSGESCDEIQEFNTKNSVDCSDDERNHNTTDFTDEETKILNIGGTNCVKEVVQVSDCDVLEDKVTEAEVKDNLEEASMDYGNCGNKNIDGNGTVFCCKLDDSEDLKSEIEEKIDQKLGILYKDAPKDLESMNAVRENKVELMSNAKLSDSQEVQEPGCLMNGLSVDITSGESSQSDLQAIDAESFTDSQNVPDAHSHIEGEEVSSSISLEEPLRAANVVKSESSGTIMFTSSNSASQFPLKQPVVIDSRIPTGLFTGGPVSNGESAEILTQEQKMKLEKLQEIVVKFLQLVHRLKGSLEDSVAERILHQLQLAAGRPYAQAFNFDFAKQTALLLEAEGENDFNFSLNVLVIGKSGVGKSATINSIFGEEKARIDAFEPGTTSVKEIMGTLDGIQIRVLDTPGLSSSLTEQSFNYKILSSIKKFTKKLPPDVVLYVDRLDAQTRDLNELPLLKLVTSSLGSSIWSRTIVTLTHAASIPPEGPSGYPLSYDVYVAKVSHVVQQLISHSVGNFDIIKPGLIPVSLIENCSLSGMDKNERTVPCSKESWRSQLLFLCYSMKFLSEIDSVVKTSRAVDYQKLIGFEVPSPSPSHLISSLLQSIVHPKLSIMEGIQSVESDIELAYSSDCDQENEDKYDKLPPFKLLKKSEIAKLSKEQRNAYFDEYDYCTKLLQKEQWNEQVKRFQEAKKKQKLGVEDNAYMEDNGTKMDSPVAVAASLPDRVLLPPLDGENPSSRYCSLESSSQFLVMPVLDIHGWDHECGYDGLSIADNFTIAGHLPAAIAVQLTGDKHDINMNSAVSVKRRNKGSTMVGLDIETVGTQLAHILKTETKPRNFKVNKTAAGVTITLLGENIIAGVKTEDHLALGKHLVFVGSTGLIQYENDTAYGAELGIRLRGKDYPINQGQTILGLSLTRWRGDLACGLNLQSQFSVRRNSELSFRAGFNSKQSGVVSIRLSSSDQPLIATLGLLRIVRTICSTLFMLLSQRNQEQ